MFAQTEHLNILDDHHLVVSYVEHRAQQSLLRVLLVTFGQILHRSFHTFGSVPEAITLWVLAETNQHFPHEVLQARTGQGLRFKYCLHLFTKSEILLCNVVIAWQVRRTDYVFIASSSSNDIGTPFVCRLTA